MVKTSYKRMLSKKRMENDIKNLVNKSFEKFQKENGLKITGVTLDIIGIKEAKLNDKVYQINKLEFDLFKDI